MPKLPRPAGQRMMWALAAPVLAAVAVAPAARAADTVPPGAVTDLAFASVGAPDLVFDPDTGTLSGVPLVFTWTATGDDGVEGQAWRYEVRFIRGRLDESSWSLAVPMADPIDLPLPSVAGEIEVLAFTEFSGLAPGAHYEVGLKVLDETGRAGPLSNVTGFEAPGEGETWSETVNVGGLRVWAWGRKLEGPEIECRYENSALLLNGWARPHIPEEPPAPTDFKRYEAVPTVQEMLGRGVAREEAVYRYLRERRAFLAEMSALGRTEGSDAVTAALTASDLVDTVMVVGRLGGYVILAGEPARAEFLWSDDEPGIPSFHYPAEYTRPTQARVAVDWLKTQAAEAGDPPGIILFARGGMMYLFNRRDIRSFEQQVEHIGRGGRLDNLPEGPLSEGPAREFVEAARHSGE